MKYTPRVIINYIVFSFLFMSISIVFGRGALIGTENKITNIANMTSALEDVQPPVFIIDPGHGGEDGGAEGSGVLEKELNLQISKSLYDICTIFGYKADLTRNKDTLLYDHFGDLSNYRGKKKTYDLRNRIRIAEESGSELYIGIHMNKFPKEQYRGLQVYYSGNTESSKDAAILIQSYAKKYIMPENNREIKKATNAIYILNRIKIPAVLIECGFLSNPDECAALKTPEYRLKLASVIFASSSEYKANTIEKQT